MGSGATGPIRVVAFDESGNTGEDLLNREQLVFALASVGISREEASLLLGATSRETRFKSARKGNAGRKNLLRILNDPVLSNETVRVVAAHKRFLVVAKMVDLLIEPLAAATGYDFYAEGVHIALSNLLYGTLPPLIGAETTTTLLEAFVSLCRAPTAEARAALVSMLRAAASDCYGPLADLLRLLADGTLVASFSGPDISDLDPAVPCLVALAHSWATGSEPFSVLHDERRELARWEPHLAALWRPVEAETFILYDGRTATYPLPVRGLSVGSSGDDPRIQIADVVAGSLRYVLSARLGTVSDPAFAQSLADTRLMSWVVQGSIWPTRDISPSDLGVRKGATPGLVDAIASWTARTN